MHITLSKEVKIKAGVSVDSVQKTASHYLHYLIVRGVTERGCLRTAVRGGAA